MDSKADKPHAVCIPCPFPSHVKAMLNLAKLLHHKGFHITFVNTDFNHNQLLRSRGSTALDGLPEFRFESIADGLPVPLDADASQGIAAVCDSIRKNLLAPFLDLLAKINNSAAPAVTCIVSDVFLAFTIKAAVRLGIPIVFFVPISASSFMGITQYSAAKEKGLTPLKDESYLTNGHLETLIDWIPGMKGIRLRDLSTIFQSTNPEDVTIHFAREAVEGAHEASAIIIHTFETLEHEVLNALSIFSRLYSIGPLQLLINQVHDNRLNSIGSNLWKDEPQCLEWLDSKKPKSVLYVNFGSLTVVTNNQLIEFAMGLANSNQSFLWIIRPGMVHGDSAILPPDFEEITRGRGFIASWCSQEEVLNHPSIGGFFTHCGWNSVLESVIAGVPMLCWPFSGDQPMNCRYVCVEWEVGTQVSSDVKRDEVEKLVRELMEGEKGKQLTHNVMELKRLAEKATSPNGSSSINLDRVVNEVLLSKASMG
ncbi:7-deoxyloganetin glucosyltransferase-like [Tripterygium wilfordii]|uniref:7-deoxyloganetin glucosyltransferase-like n=1 Tax=Tripterygium wilfordii TaxID=458696 RepID=UPI0018F7F047|nr:7-deoxyloganetin glucosyltransferase-like [Tripterygium wilfordii]